MRAILLALLIALTGFPTASAGTFELNPQYRPKQFQGRDTAIDPDSSVYGVKFGSTEAEVVAAFGEPQGVIIINIAKKAFLYGHSHLFIFRKGKFRELMVSDHVIDWRVTKQMEDHPFFDHGRWVIKPGLRKEMSFTKVLKVLNRPNGKPKYRYVIDGERSSTTLLFTSRGRGPAEPESYHLQGVSIVHYGY